MPAHRKRSHGSNTAGGTGSDLNQQLDAGRAAIATVLGGSLVLISTPVHAGLLRTMLNAIKPRIKPQLEQECSRLIRQRAVSIRPLIETTCWCRTEPANECFVEEASKTGSVLG
ncbi:hypothetical protein [Synechococcus sp. MIT S1220]|uniref:hypothetical protein n=1 Tax=Synechococcus sp. MIT S1220 TaxID=3082549 RepID=UPI0039AF0919